MQQEYLELQFGKAVVKTAKFCNFADVFYKLSATPREVFDVFFGCLKQRNLVGAFALGEATSVQKSTDAHPKKTPGAECFEDPWPNKFEVIHAAFSDFCAVYEARFALGDFSNPWFMAHERQAMRDIMATWQEAGMIADFTFGDGRPSVTPVSTEMYFSPRRPEDLDSRHQRPA